MSYVCQQLENSNFFLQLVLKAFKIRTLKKQFNYSIEILSKS